MARSLETDRLYPDEDFLRRTRETTDVYTHQDLWRRSLTYQKIVASRGVISAECIKILCKVYKPGDCWRAGLDTRTVCAIYRTPHELNFAATTLRKRERARDWQNGDGIYIAILSGLPAHTFAIFAARSSPSRAFT
jgi:hypothetical protein